MTTQTKALLLASQGKVSRNPTTQLLVLYKSFTILHQREKEK
ncbi:hypothetical protein BN1183_BV_00020 [Pantoea ananatis]|nr:hypothetical protein BN1183_BV_00020 [Pantoea ananatis]